MNPVELNKKLAGLAKVWALVEPSIGLIYSQLFIRPGPLSRVGYPFQL